MAWERGYYYRVRRENGRVVREYIGRGRPAELIAKLDELDREKARLDAQALRKEQAELDTLDADLKALIEITDRLARAAGRRLSPAQARGMEKTPRPPSCQRLRRPQSRRNSWRLS